MAREWKAEWSEPCECPMATYGAGRVVLAGKAGLDVEEKDPLPWDVVATLASRHPSGLAAMATALRAAGWTVAEPGAESKLIARHTEYGIVAERWVRVPGEEKDR